MQQIYKQSDQHLEVYTTVFSPQVCRRSRRCGEPEQAVAVMEYRSRWPKELDLKRGDAVRVLFKEDQTWWFGCLSDGSQGYFPAACVEPLQVSDSAKATPTLLRRGSVPVVVATAGAPCDCTSGRSTPKPLRKSSVRRSPAFDGGSAAAMAPPPHASPSLFHRVLSKSRRKSCPHLRPPPPQAGSINTAFQPD